MNNDVLKLIERKLPRTFKQVEVYPLADLHIGDGKTDLKLFQAFKKFVLAEPYRFIILNGDLMNNAIKTSVSNVYNESMCPSEQKKWLVYELKELKDRILCITTGNHEARNNKDVDNDITYDIACMLGLEHLYSKNGVVLKLLVGRNTRGNQRQICYTFYATHGSGGGGLPGSSINRLENYAMAFENVDIFIMSHVHKKIAGRASKLVVDTHNNVVTQRDVLHVITAAWQDYGGYAQNFMLRPGVKGATPIILSGSVKDFHVTI